MALERKKVKHYSFITKLYAKYKKKTKVKAEVKYLFYHYNARAQS